uniref:Uncharacterized protein n=1 Tax=Physcomitrium patens TaxID=3218 RepID=A0A2K1K257_PHYPA|nr:hypothetical protein PHYPA_012325 [Physcomitrium patens]
MLGLSMPVLCSSLETSSLVGRLLLDMIHSARKNVIHNSRTEDSPQVGFSVNGVRRPEGLADFQIELNEALGKVGSSPFDEHVLRPLPSR